MPAVMLGISYVNRTRVFDIYMVVSMTCAYCGIANENERVEGGGGDLGIGSGTITDLIYIAMYTT